MQPMVDVGGGRGAPGSWLLAPGPWLLLDPELLDEGGEEEDISVSARVCSMYAACLQPLQGLKSSFLNCKGTTGSMETINEVRKQACCAG